MNYFLDTKFLEGSRDKKFLGIRIGKATPFTDLISIGIVSDDGREYYAIFKEFDLKEAWGRHNFRENVLNAIFRELTIREAGENNDIKHSNIFNLKNLSRLIKKYGKSNSEITKEVFEFINQDKLSGDESKHQEISPEDEFYTYYGSNEWFISCWTFGKIIARDLKQMLQEKVEKSWTVERKSFGEDKIKNNTSDETKEEIIYNALTQAHWNKKLYEFLQGVLKWV